jgi:hypothetical protein
MADEQNQRVAQIALEPRVTFRRAAVAGFSRLAQQFVTPSIFEGNFWFGGNTLRTCLDYLLGAKQPDTQGLVRKAFDVYSSLESKGGWWRDDYGWWGTAFLVAIRNQSALGYPPDEPLFTSLRTATAHCWQQLNDNWSDTHYPGAPTISGGVFNTKQQETMAGRNSVTNEQFWLLSDDLAALEPTQPEYAGMAAAEQEWFGRWLALPGKPPNTNGILNENSLVLERPLGNQDDPSWYWSGDQGLFISALAGSGKEELASKIAQSVVTNMTDDELVLHENLGFTANPSLAGFIADYATGKGVLMRNLSSFVQPDPSPLFVDFITKNAAAVWCNQLAGTQFAFNWNPPVAGHEPTVLSVDGKSRALCDLIMQAAGQDALNAALAIAPDKEITCPGQAPAPD